MNDAKVVAEKLLQVNAVKLRPHDPFTWASGWKSPIYCDNRSILSYPFVRDFIKSEMCNVLFEQFSQADCVAGVATAGIPWGALAADQLKLPFIYVRPKPKEHGLGNQIEGLYEKGQRIVVVEDLVSTAKSSLQAIDALEASGLIIEGMVSIFTYDFSVAIELLAARNIKYVPLTNYSVLIELAKEKGMINETDIDLLLEWRKDPANWKTTKI